MPEVSNLFVCLMGMGVTFIGLTCLILLTVLMGKIVRGKEDVPSAAAPSAAIPAAEAAPNRQEMIAAVAACLAEELGTDVSAIRILSFQKIA